MAVKKEDKQKLVAKFGWKDGNTWCPEVQIAILTHEIENLKNHLQIHKKDNHSRRGIMMMVAKRRKMLNYLKRKNPSAYEQLLVDLEIRK